MFSCARSHNKLPVSNEAIAVVAFAEGYGFFIEPESGYISFAAVCVGDDPSQAAFSSLLEKFFRKPLLFMWNVTTAERFKRRPPTSQLLPGREPTHQAQAACHNEETRCWCCCCCCCCRRRHPSATFGQTLYPFACAAAALSLNMVSS